MLLSNYRVYNSLFSDSKKYKIEFLFFTVVFITTRTPNTSNAKNMNNNANLISALNEIAMQSSVSCVTRLAEKYGFDPAEATDFIKAGSSGDSNVKGTKSRAKAKARSKGKSSDSSSDEDSSKPKSKAKSKKSKSGEKRAPTGYMTFCCVMRPTVVSEMSDELGDGEKLPPQSVVKELGARWKALDTSGQEEWNAKAKAVAEKSKSAEVDSE